MTAAAGSRDKQDVFVRISPIGGPLDIRITSTVQDLFGRAIRETAESLLAELGVTSGRVDIRDNQALDYVLKARIESAVADMRETQSW